MRPSPKTVAQAKLILKADRSARKAARPQRIDHSRSKPKGGRERDAGFMAWQHESGLACIACEVLGAPTPDQIQGFPNPLEVAHQRVNGWKKGVRGDDAASCVLCRWHHQTAPNACDRGQTKFWARLEIDPADYCQALYAAFKGGQDGRAVQRRFIPGRIA